MGGGGGCCCPRKFGLKSFDPVGVEPRMKSGALGFSFDMAEFGFDPKSPPGGPPRLEDEFCVGNLEWWKSVVLEVVPKPLRLDPELLEGPPGFSWDSPRLFVEARAEAR